jgi:predicted dehydrogenase
MAQKVHLPNFSAIEECRIEALAEVRDDLGRKVRQRFAIDRLYGHHLEMARDRDLDAFAVSAAYGVQGRIASDLLRTGRPVFMEKPMAISLAQAQDVLEAARSPGARLMLGYMKRYDAGNELVHDAIQRFRQNEELGPLTYVRAHGFCGDWISGLDTPVIESAQAKPDEPVAGPEWLPPEYLKPYISYLQQYTHNVNLMRYFLEVGDGIQVRSVDLDDDGYGGVVLFDAGGVRCALESGRLEHHRWDEHTQVYFRRGWIKTWAPPLLLKNAPAEVEIYRGGKKHVYSRPLPRDRWSWSYMREARHFVEAVRSGGPFRSSGEDSLTDVRLFEEIFRRFMEMRGKL